MKKSIYVLIISCVLWACGDKQPNKFSDPILVKIADFQDKRLSDSLMVFFENKNPTYRKEAALAFASVQNPSAVDNLQKLLRFDKDPQVRRAVAIALGQISTDRSAAVLWKALGEEKDPVVLREVIEGCGKTFSQLDIPKLVVNSIDPLTDEGLAWAYYRLGLRGQADSTLIAKALPYLNSRYASSTRLGAASFFSRAPIRIKSAEAELINSALKDESPWVRAAATTALKKINTPNSVQSLNNIALNDTDYRVRIAAIRALGDFEFERAKSSLYKALADKELNVAIASAEVIRNTGTSFEADTIESLAKKATHWRIKANLYETILLVLNDKRVAKDVIDLYNHEQNPYAKAAYLTALGQTTHAWRFIDLQLHATSIPAIKSSAAGALVSVNANNEFSDSLKLPFVKSYISAIQTGDPAVIGTAAGALMDLRFPYYKEMIKDYSFLYEARKKLSLPKDNEALQSLEATIAYFEEKKGAGPVKNEFNHSIDWGFVKTISKDQQVLIKTEKGDITLKLLVEEAPGSVANFVQLINAKYFDGKNFHRVVPNFVIQGGCNRGDGWGSEDYSIRSEFTDRHYAEGSVGMASAGKDTEGTQWFITHSPTPHLDGRYTIFAITESGMDVVHRIEVGDKILSVTLIK